MQRFWIWTRPAVTAIEDFAHLWVAASSRQVGRPKKLIEGHLYFYFMYSGRSKSSLIYVERYMEI